MKPTSATPISSAAAVTEVRRGLRPAFSRASVPVMPLSVAIGEPIVALAQRAYSGPEHEHADEYPDRAEEHEPDAAVGEQAEEQEDETDHAQPDADQQRGASG